MTQISRREFLLSISAGLSALAIDQLLIACGQREPLASPTATPPAKTVAATAPITPSLSPTTPASGQASASPASETVITSEPQATVPATSLSGIPDLVIARGGEPEEMVRRAMAALGGIEKYVNPGANVIIKPNICVAYHTYEYAATTNPWVVAALVKLCKEAGAASVRVMDAPFGGTAKEAYAISGIAEQVIAAGGEMSFMPGFKYVSKEIPNAMSLKKTDVFDDILKADVVINVPIAKHHSLARLTVGMKNLMGVIRDRSAMHSNLAERLPDLASLIKPTLTVVDAVRILMDHGPTGGNLDDVKKLDTLIVSRDIVAADSYATTLFGLQPESIGYIVAGNQSGLGRMNLSELRIEEIAVGA